MNKEQDAAPQKAAQEIAARTAAELQYELVEITMQKGADGMVMCIYIDKPGGITLDDCERYHKAVQPLLSQVAYDYLEVSSPGADRPVNTRRDFEKRRGDKVEIRLFAKLDGVKQFTGALTAMDDDTVTITLADGQERTFPRKAVALIKPVIDVTDDEE